MFKKIGKWIKRNIGFSIVICLAIVLLIIMAIIIVDMLVGGSNNKYGNRLEGIEKVEISNKTYKKVEEELTGSNLVESAETRLQGKIVYTTIVLKSDASVSTAKDLATQSLKNYSEDELKYYDFSFFLKWKGEEKDTVITGNKHHNADGISWVRSQEQL